MSGARRWSAGFRRLAWAAARLQAIAHPAHGRDPALSQLLAEVPNIDIHDIRAGIEVVAPDVAQELLAAEHLPRMPEEHVGEAELPSGQLDAPGADGQPSRPQIEHRVADLEDGRLSRPALAQARPHPGQELLESEWLRDIVVGAALESGHRVLDAITSGQDDDRL